MSEEKRKRGRAKGWSTRGENGGRPKGSVRGITRVYHKVNLAILEEDYKAIVKRAESLGLTKSRYLVNLALKDIKESD